MAVGLIGLPREITLIPPELWRDRAWRVTNKSSQHTADFEPNEQAEGRKCEAVGTL